MRWQINERPWQTSGQFLPILRLRFPTPQRFKRKETQQYNSFLPRFEPGFLTARG